MSNTESTNTSPEVLAAVVVRDAAADELALAARRLKANLNGPLEDLYENEMNVAFAAFEVACDDLREVRDGYRHTYPHPITKFSHGNRYPMGGRHN